MKKIFLTASCLVSLAYGQGVFQTEGNTWLVTSPQTSIVLHNMHLQNNSLNPQINGVLRFSGNLPVNFGGIHNQQVYALELEKEGNAEVLLQKNLGVDGNIRFYGGNLNLGDAVVELSQGAKLIGEMDHRRAFTAGDGYFTVTTTMNAPSIANAGNLGIFITSPANLGLVTVKRGHKVQAGPGIGSSIQRYFEITPANNSNLNATIEMLYFDGELNGQNEASLSIFQNTGNGGSWALIGTDQKSAEDNFARKGGLSALYRYTLAAPAGAPLPVTGLEFVAKRLNTHQVQLNWNTQQEADNKGFTLERRKESEQAFYPLQFISTKAPAGNSAFPLYYQQLDTNSFNGRTYYRLKQEDISGRFAYSVVRVVQGTTGGASLKAWPVPAPKEFSVSITGIQKDVLQVIDMAGRVVKQQNISDGAVIKITGLIPGAYLVTLKEHKDLSQKIIVQ